MLCADHGPCVSGAHTTIVTARAGKDLVSSLVSGKLEIQNFVALGTSKWWDHSCVKFEDQEISSSTLTTPLPQLVIIVLEINRNRNEQFEFFLKQFVIECDSSSSPNATRLLP